jgi:hypothetical protein
MATPIDDLHADDPSHSAGFESGSTKIDFGGLWTNYVEALKSPVETIKSNFFSKAPYSKGNRLATGIKLASVAVGGAFAIDALRSEYEGPDGRPEQRSGLVRLAELVTGGALAVGGAFYRR